MVEREVLAWRIASCLDEGGEDDDDDEEQVGKEEVVVLIVVLESWIEGKCLRGR